MCKTCSFLLATITLLLLQACQSPIPRIEPSSSTLRDRPASEIADLERGRETYIAKCSGCHAVYSPARGDASYWRRQVEEMAGRTRIDAEEQRLILTYIEYARLSTDKTKR